MKKIAVVLAVVTVAILFAGCGVSQAEVDEQVSTAYNTGYSEGEEAGYEEGYDEGAKVGDEAAYQEVEEVLGMTVEEAKTNLDYLAFLPEPLHDPTYDELMEFLEEDKTEENIDEEGDCYSHIVYAHLLLNNAKEAGIQGYVVVARIINHRHLVFAGFETTDKGWIYILSWPPADREIRLEVGKDYCGLNGGPPLLASMVSEDFTIRGIVIFD